MGGVIDAESIEQPIFGFDASDNNMLNVKEAVNGWGARFGILRRTGGLDGRGGVWRDAKWAEFNRAILQTDAVPGDYAFPVNPEYVDIERQVDVFLHHGTDDFDGRIVALDYEPYWAQPDATCTIPGLKAFIEELRRHIGGHPILIYAGRSFWEGPPHSGQISEYGPNIRLWAPWWYSRDPVQYPKRYYYANVDRPGNGWWQSFGGQLPVMSQFCIGRVAGIPLDCNAYRLTEDRLRWLASNQDLPEQPDRTLTEEIAAIPATGDWGLDPWPEKVTKYIIRKFGAFSWIEGFRVDSWTEHNTANGVDLGLNGDQRIPMLPEHRRRGWEIVRWMLANRAELRLVGIVYLNQQIGYVDWGYSDWSGWRPQYELPDNWRQMEANGLDPRHMRHIHFRAGD